MAERRPDQHRARNGPEEHQGLPILQAEQDARHAVDGQRPEHPGREIGLGQPALLPVATIGSGPLAANRNPTSALAACVGRRSRQKPRAGVAESGGLGIHLGRAIVADRRCGGCSQSVTVLSSAQCASAPSSFAGSAVRPFARLLPLLAVCIQLPFTGGAAIVTTRGRRAAGVRLCHARAVRRSACEKPEWHGSRRGADRDVSPAPRT